MAVLYIEGRQNINGRVAIPERVSIHLNYRTSMAPTLMALLPRLFQTVFLVPRKNTLAADLG